MATTKKLAFLATFVAPKGKVSRIDGSRTVVKAIVATDLAHATRIAHRMGLGTPASVRLDEVPLTAGEDPAYRSSRRNIFATDGGWPGDGSGMDDLADFNQLEGRDN